MSRRDERGEFTDFVMGYQGKMVRLAELQNSGSSASPEAAALTPSSSPTSSTA